MMRRQQFDRLDEQEAKAAERRAADEAYLTNPLNHCQAMWFTSSGSFHQCQRPVAQYIPHEHRVVEGDHRYSVAWATPGNWHNRAEESEIQAITDAWLNEPLETVPRPDPRDAQA